MSATARKESAALEAIAAARQARDQAEQEFRKLLVQARPRHSWAELAQVAGLSRAGVRWLAENEDQRAKDAARRARRKGEK